MRIPSAVKIQENGEIGGSPRRGSTPSLAAAKGDRNGDTHKRQVIADHNSENYSEGRVEGLTAGLMVIEQAIEEIGQKEDFHSAGMAPET